MIRVEDQPALILHRRAYRESSLLLDVLTRDHGITGMVVKGVNSPKNHVLRAQLQPLQHVRLTYQQRSDLALLTRSEAIGPARPVSGERLMAGMYFNELVLKLCPRQDADRALYALLLEAYAGLSGTAELAWLARRFERDLLGHLGYPAPWSFSASGRDIDPGDTYRMHAELGLMPCAAEDPAGIAGAELLAFIDDRMPARPALQRLRAWLHAVIALHTGKATPRSWKIIGDLSKPLLTE